MEQIDEMRKQQELAAQREAKMAKIRRRVNLTSLLWVPQIIDKALVLKSQYFN